MLCEEGKTVHVLNAVYGRTDKLGGSSWDEIKSGSATTGCGPDRNDQCALDVSVDLTNFCSSQNSCEIPNGQLGTFFTGLTGQGDPCPNTNKYLNFTYSCF